MNGTSPNQGSPQELPDRRLAALATPSVWAPSFLHLDTTEASPGHLLYFKPYSPRPVHNNACSQGMSEASPSPALPSCPVTATEGEALMCCTVVTKALERPRRKALGRLHVPHAPAHCLHGLPAVPMTGRRAATFAADRHDKLSTPRTVFHTLPQTAAAAVTCVCKRTLPHLPRTCWPRRLAACHFEALVLCEERLSIRANEGMWLCAVHCEHGCRCLRQPRDAWGCTGLPTPGTPPLPGCR